MQEIRKIYFRKIFNTMLTRAQIASFSSDSITVKQDEHKNQFFAEINGEQATIDYAIKANRMVLIHTEVPEMFRGKGVAKILAKEAFTYASKNKMEVKIECHYLADHYDSNKGKYPGVTIK